MWIELNADNGLHLYAETESGYNIDINFGFTDRTYTDLNAAAYKLFKEFNVKDNVIFIRDGNDNILAMIRKRDE